MSPGECQVATPQCRIQKCTTDFVSLTSHLTTAVDAINTEFCKALRAYSACTQRTAKACRGNLVFHSAVLGISDLMTQRNCSSDGPTSSTHPEVHFEPCNYHSRTQHAHTHAHAHSHAHSHAHGHSPPVYLFCGLFGDPHLRTFKDSFQTCKVEGAWPLIDNDYLSVQVTNVPVVPGSSATATNKVRNVFCCWWSVCDMCVLRRKMNEWSQGCFSVSLKGILSTWGWENTAALLFFLFPSHSLCLARCKANSLILWLSLVTDAVLEN